MVSRDSNLSPTQRRADALSVEPRSRVKGDGWWIKFFLARCEYHFIRIHENLTHYPCNNISIHMIQLLSLKCRLGDLYGESVPF